MPLAARVNQGYPLSPIHFNVAMEPVVGILQYVTPEFGYPMCGRHFSVAAKSNDMALIAAGAPVESAAGHSRAVSRLALPEDQCQEIRQPIHRLQCYAACPAHRV